MTPKEVIMAYAEALGKGDVPAAFSFFSTEIKWHQPGANQFSGIKTGADDGSCKRYFCLKTKRKYYG